MVLCEIVPARVVLGVFGFLGFAILYSLRVNLSVALVAMSNTTVQRNTNNKTYTSECSRDNMTRDKTLLEGEFPYSETTQGVILSAFFYGYLISQVRDFVSYVLYIKM